MSIESSESIKLKKELSLIIPIYNAEKYLEECLESVYSLDIDKEIILINDASQDSSAKIIKRYEEEYPEITKVIFQENQGAGVARNNGLKIAKGKYVSFIDSDDWINKEEFEKIFKSLKNKDLDMIVGDFYKIENEKPLKLERNIETKKILEGFELAEILMDKQWFRTESCINIYNLEFLRKHNIEFTEKIIYEDVEFVIKSFFFAKKVTYEEVYFYNYRDNLDSIMNKKITENNHRAIFVIIKKLIEFYEKEKINNTSWNSFLIEMYYRKIKEWEIKNSKLQKKILRLKINRLKIKKRKLKILYLSLKATEIEI